MTSTKAETLQEWLSKANPNNLADALRACNLGHMFAPIKVVVTGMTAEDAVDITDPDIMDGTNTITGITLADGENLPPIGVVRTLRVTAATTGSQVGTCIVTDAGGTALTPGTSSVVGVAKLSDDGTTITFVGDVTAFVLEYYPRIAVPMSTDVPIVAP